jgi:hypothetical protein
MPTKEELMAASKAADDAAIQLHLAHLCVIAAYEIEESPAARAKYPFAPLASPCVAAAAAIETTISAKHIFERLVRLCDRYALEVSDVDERHWARACAAGARAQLRCLSKLVAEGAREFALACPDVAARLGFEVIVVPDREAEQEGGSN